MVYDFSRITGRIIEKYGTRARFASAVGMSSTHLSKILNGRAFLRHEAIDEWAEALDLTTDDIGAYFFTKNVHEHEQEETCRI